MKLGFQLTKQSSKTRLPRLEVKASMKSSRKLDDVSCPAVMLEGSDVVSLSKSEK